MSMTLALLLGSSCSWSQTGVETGCLVHEAETGAVAGGDDPGGDCGDLLVFEGQQWRLTCQAVSQDRVDEASVSHTPIVVARIDGVDSSVVRAVRDLADSSCGKVAPWTVIEKTGVSSDRLERASKDVNRDGSAVREEGTASSPTEPGPSRG